MAKTLVERVLEVANRKGGFNRRIAKRSCRNRDAETLHNTVLRTARYLYQGGYLGRTDVGNYEITVFGRQRLGL